MVSSYGKILVSFRTFITSFDTQSLCRLESLTLDGIESCGDALLSQQEISAFEDSSPEQKPDM